MKRSIIILALVLLAKYMTFGQTEEFKPSYSFGIKQGVNYSTVTFSPGIDQGLMLGYTGGLVFKYQNEKNWAIQLELNYIQKGWKENLDTISNSYNRKLNYVELPLITHIVLGKRPQLKYYINLGTSFAYFLSEQENVTVNNELFRREYYEKEIENYFDYSVLGELGLIYNTGLGEFQIGIRYQLTLTDLFETTSTTIFDNSQNQLWNLSITYFLFSNKE